MTDRRASAALGSALLSDETTSYYAFSVTLVPLGSTIVDAPLLRLTIDPGGRTG